MKTSARTKRTRAKMMQCKACQVLAPVSVFDINGLCLSCRDQLTLWPVMGCR